MALKACEDWDKLAFGEMGILLICPNCPMPICSGAHFSWWPFPPNAHLPSITKYCPNVHRSQSAHLPHKCQFIGPNVLICSTVPICSGAYFFWCPFPPMPTCPNVHRSQCPHLLHSAHLPHKCPFALVLIFPGVYLPQVPICPQCPLAPMLIGPKLPICSKVPIMPQSAHKPVTSSLVSNFDK